MNACQAAFQTGIIQEFRNMSAMRMLFLAMACLILLGIWLTGFNVVHWVLYIPVAALIFAAATGICPGYIIFKKLGFKGDTISDKL
jgi:diacylglycerol kinase